MTKKATVKTVAFFLLLITSSGLADTTPLATAIQRSRELKLSEREEWRRLLHYNHTLLRFYESQADGSSFFVSPDGKKSLQDELEATLEGYFKGTVREWPGTKIPQQSVRCQFPARWRWLSTELGLKDSDLPKTEPCTKYEEWRTKIGAKSVTLVFSSYYLNNPSSAFGHSLLRLNKTEVAEGSEHAQLLDYGINYAASATTSNALLYAIYGLSGVFAGEFTNIPYYYKVREYNDSESRDLWEYDLNLTRAEVDQLVDHLWELGSTYFDYYYLTENCSYHMLTSIEAAAPRLHLTDHLPFWIIPADTIKALRYEPDLIKRIHYRPSVRTQFLTRTRTLESEEERDALDEISRTRQLKGLYEKLNPIAQARVLDAAVDYIDYKYSKKIFEKEKAFMDWKQSFLVARSHLPTTPQLVVPQPEQETPHNSHASTRLGAGYIRSQDALESTDLSVRFALHDLADPVQGYLPSSKIEFMNLRFRYDNKYGDFKLREGLLFSVDSVSSWNRYEKPISWRMQVGEERVEDLRCNDCLSTVFRTGGGITWDWLKKPLLSQYVMLSTNINTSPLFPGDKWSLAIGPLTGIRMAITPKFILHGEGGWRYVWHSSPQELPFSIVHLRYSPDLVWALNFSSEWTKKGSETGVTLFWYL